MLVIEIIPRGKSMVLNAILSEFGKILFKENNVKAKKMWFRKCCGSQCWSEQVKPLFMILATSYIRVPV